MKQFQFPKSSQTRCSDSSAPGSPPGGRVCRSTGCPVPGCPALRTPGTHCGHKQLFPKAGGLSRERRPGSCGPEMAQPGTGLGWDCFPNAAETERRPVLPCEWGQRGANTYSIYTRKLTLGPHRELAGRPLLDGTPRYLSRPENEGQQGPRAPTPPQEQPSEEHRSPASPRATRHSPGCDPCRGGSPGPGGAVCRQGRTASSRGKGPHPGDNPSLRGGFGWWQVRSTRISTEATGQTRGSGSN